MSSCGVNIPLEALVEALVDNYADVFAGEIIKRLDLNRFVKVESGEAKDLTLRSSLTADEKVKADLCSMLQDCIADKIKEEIGCMGGGNNTPSTDDYVTKFYIDKANDRLAIELRYGTVLFVTRQDLLDWLNIQAAPSTGGGVRSGELIIQANAPTKLIRLTNKDNTTADVDISALTDLHITRGEMVGSTLRLHRSDSTTVDVVLDLPTAVDTYRINTQAEDYTLAGQDFNGNTIVRADKNGDQTVTVGDAPSAAHVGKSIIIRKTSGAVGTFVTVKPAAGVTFVPDDASPLRRVGSAVTLVYVGNGVYDVFGELP